MVRHLNPPGMMSPYSVNTHGIEVGPDHRVLYTSGQVGQCERGEIPDGIVAQTKLAWGNLEKVLDASGMGLEHLVHVNSYLTRREDLDAFFDARESYMLPGRPTATLVIVAGLAHPEWLVEIEGYAAAPVVK